MAAYDGTDFVGIDDASYADAQPVDAWLDQRIRGNNLYLERNQQYVTNAFLSGDVAPADGAPYYQCRPWCSVDWSAPICIPFWLESGMSGADMSLWSYASGTGAIQLNVTASRLDRVIASDAASFSGDIESEGQQALSATIQSGLTRQEWGSVQIWVQSIVDDTATATLDLTLLGRSSTRIINTDTAITYASNLPTASSLDVSALITTDGVATDLLAANTTSGDLLGGGIIGASSTVGQHPMSYLQCRSAAIRSKYSGQELPVSAASLAARRAVRGAESTKIAQQVQVAYDRKSLIAWGPSGYLPPERTEEWPALMPMRFRGVQANAATGISSALAQTAIMWRREGGTMHVALHLVGVYHGGSPGADVGSSDWTLSVSLETPNASDTDWSSATVLASGSRTMSIGTHSSSVNLTPGASRLLSMRRWNYVRASGPSTQTWDYIHRDGQLYREDLALITPVVIEVDASSLATGDMGMLRVDADYLTGTFDGFSSSQATPSELGYQLEVVCTGFSIWQGA
jgi:hypothetical protein